MLAASIIRAMVEAVGSSETSVSFLQDYSLTFPEDSHIHTRRSDNLKCHVFWLLESCTLLVLYGRFGRKYCLCFQLRTSMEEV
jgi:hypothetical protein